MKAFDALHAGYSQYVWSPNGRTLAILHAATHPQTLELLQPSSLQPSRIVKLPELNAFGYLTSWSPDGTRILINGKEPIVVSVENGAIEAAPLGGGLLLWTAQGGLKPLPIPVRAFLQAPDCRLVALLQDYDHLVVWDTQENRALWTVTVPPERGVGELAWSPDSQRLASVSKPGSVDIWDRSTSRVLERLTTPGTWPWIGPSYLIWREKLVAVIRLGGAVQLWREP